MRAAVRRFLLVVVFISVLVFAPLGRPTFVIRILSRLLLIPVISGIAYEVLRFTAKHATNPIMGAIIKPNLALQKLTTREPDDSMIEVAIAALKAVLSGEQIANCRRTGNNTMNAYAFMRLG